MILGIVRYTRHISLCKHETYFAIKRRQGPYKKLDTSVKHGINNEIQSYP